MNKLYNKNRRFVEVLLQSSPLLFLCMKRNMEGGTQARFTFYGEQLLPMWDSFKLALNRRAENEGGDGIVYISSLGHLPTA